MNALPQPSPATKSEIRTAHKKVFHQFHASSAQAIYRHAAAAHRYNPFSYIKSYVQIKSPSLQGNHGCSCSYSPFGMPDNVTSHFKPVVLTLLSALCKRIWITHPLSKVISIVVSLLGLILISIKRVGKEICGTESNGRLPLTAFPRVPLISKAITFVLPAKPNPRLSLAITL